MPLSASLCRKIERIAQRVGAKISRLLGSHAQQRVIDARIVVGGSLGNASVLRKLPSVAH
jgi:hypothetical protein